MVTVRPCRLPLPSCPLCQQWPR